MPEKLLIVDDEPDILGMLKDYFELGGYQVMTASDGREAVKKAGESPSLILLDINMPGLNGLEVCMKIRSFVSCPILFLTARTQENDRIHGLGVGGDDYIVKPFSLEELGARVDAHLRREKRRQASPRVRFDGELCVDFAGRTLYFKDTPVPLTAREFDILELLCVNRGQVFDKERIYERVWGWDSEGESSIVVEYIRRIRVKFSSAGAACPLKTVWGVGYKWE